MGAAALLSLLALTAPRTPPWPLAATAGRALDEIHDESVATKPFGFGPLPATAPAIDPAADARTLIGIAAEAGRALAADPSSAEAAFTRALALERLHLAHVARKAWEKALDLAAGTELATEAREHLEALQNQPTADEVWATDRAELESDLAADDGQRVRELADRHRQRVRQWIQDELLPRWAEAAQGGDEARATRSLDSARRLAPVLERLTDDHLTTDSVAAIDRATGIARGQLAQGHALYGKARQLHDRQDYGNAGPLFERAAAGLAAGGSPFSLWPRLYLAIEAYHRFGPSGALPELRRLETGNDASHNPILDGYIHWITFLALSESGPAPAALPDCELAGRRFQRAGELENSVAMENSAAASLVLSGDLDGAWRYLDSAFRVRGLLGTGRRRENMLLAALDAFRASNEPTKAFLMAREVLAEARARKNPLGISLALRAQGVLLGDLGAGEDALSEHLAQAQAAAEEIPDSVFRHVIESEALVARGRSRCTYDPARGVEDLDRAESFLHKTDRRGLLIEVLANRARCRRALGDTPGAQDDLTRALRELLRQRKLIHDPSLRAFYVDQARSVLEARVALALDRGDGNSAFTTVERLRAPVLLEAMGKGAPAAEPELLTQSLPRGTTLVEFVSLDKELVAWILDGHGMSLLRIPVSRKALIRDVQAFRRAIARGESPPDSEIETRLLGPILPELGNARSVVVVPDGPLYGLPFGALRDPATGRYLAERFAFATAPSSRAYRALQERATRLETSRPRTVLAVGGVPFARRLFPNLEALPGSAKEARAVAAAYPEGTVLSGEGATPERFLADAPAFDVIHLATHAVDLPENPEMASLLLAPGDDGATDGVLPARGLRSPRPLSAQVVVLAACRTAAGRISASEGPLNLARPFLAAGAPTVVAALWALDETTSLAFSVRFHAVLAAGAAPIDAFHRAQLGLLRSPDPRLSAPRSWAGLTLIGATGGTASH